MRAMDYYPIDEFLFMSAVNTYQKSNWVNLWVIWENAKDRRMEELSDFEKYALGMTVELLEGNRGRFYADYIH